MSDQMQSERPRCRETSPTRFSALQRAEILRNVEFFSRATVEELLHLAAISSEVHFRTEEVIYREGEIAEALYILIEGKVAIKGTNIDEVLAPHEAVGLYAVLSGEPRHTSAQALEDAYALKIDAQDFFDLLSHNTEIVQSLFKLLTQRLIGSGKLR